MGAGRLLKLLLVVIALVILATAWSCSIANGRWEVVEGRRFPVANAQRVQEGMDETLLRQLLGEPLEVRREGEWAEWRYFVRETKAEHLMLNGYKVFSWGRIYYGCEGNVRFSRGHVEKRDFHCG